MDWNDLSELGLSLQSSVIHNDKQSQRKELIALVNQLDLPEDQWYDNLHELWKYDRDCCEECISNFCASYIENGVSSLRMVCERLVRDTQLTFLLRCQAAEALGNYFYMFEVLNDYMINPKDDINLTLFVDNVIAMVNVSDFTMDMLINLMEWVFTTKAVLWSTKYKLYKTLCDVRIKETGFIVSLGKLLITSNPLSNWTVLCLQLTKFDDKTLKSILQRTKLSKDVKLKADIYDHMLNYSNMKQEALQELKKIGEGLKTLDSSQNVHMLSADVDSWITKNLFSPTSKSTAEIIEEIKKLWSATLEASENDKLNYALLRLDLDNTLYGKSHLKLNTILARVWTLIQNHEHKDELMKRLKEELIEMSETCSTGHLYRLMNVFSGYGVETLTLDPKVELRSVINKRVEHYMNSLPEDVRDLVYEAWMDQQEDVLRTHLYKKLAEIHDEVFADYVNQCIMEQQEFTTAYRDIINNLFVS